jgi:aminoglycoside/choline kinase family phosphotransferase
VLRDYHAENLIWLPRRAGHARVGMLDYQDMLLGHPAYDLVSLLEDARRDTSPELRAAMLARYLAWSGAEPEAFAAAAHTLAAQRNLKILGLFTRLCRRDGKPRYLAHLPRVWGHLSRDLAHPALAPLAAFVARHLPAPETAVRARIGAAA